MLIVSGGEVVPTPTDPKKFLLDSKCSLSGSRKRKDPVCDKLFRARSLATTNEIYCCVVFYEC